MAASAVSEREREAQVVRTREREVGRSSEWRGRGSRVRAILSWRRKQETKGGERIVQRVWARVRCRWDGWALEGQMGLRWRLGRPVLSLFSLSPSYFL